MQIEGNTVLITGGGSGIGRALAEAFHARGSRVVIAGRRAETLQSVTSSNPGIEAVPLDLDDPAAIREFAGRLTHGFPDLNVLVNNAGIMRPEDLTSAPASLPHAEQIVTTNLLGPIRLTAALLPHLRSRPRSAIINVTSGLAFVPLAVFPTYSATKSALHSYTVSLRHQLRGTSTEVIEVAPPYVQTHLTGERHASDPRAMPLGEFIEESMKLLSCPGATEVIVERCRPLRSAAEGSTMAETFAFLNSQDY